MGMSDQGLERPKLVIEKRFCVDTEALQFTNWMKMESEDRASKLLPTGEGPLVQLLARTEFALREMTSSEIEAAVKANRPIYIAIRATLLGESLTAYSPLVMELRVMALATGWLDVVARCLNPTYEYYFHELIDSIGATGLMFPAAKTSGRPRGPNLANARRDKRIIELRAKGLSYGQIGEQFTLAAETIKAICKKGRKESGESLT